MGTNLRQKQTAALNRMLNFNVPLADSEGGVVNPSEWSDHVRRTCLPSPRPPVVSISAPRNANQPTHRTTHTCPQWKVLIYDRKCRDIISPLLNVSKLRKRGVTLHLLLEAEREDIPDVVC